MHRNSQKRIHIPGAIYFVTTVTKGRIRYFENPHLAMLLTHELWAASTIKGFRIAAYVILPDHLHLILQPNVSFSLSQCIFTIKKQFSHEANRLLGWNADPPSNAGGQTFARLRGYVQAHRQKELETRFAWQHSFHDHIIRNDDDFAWHMEYIHYNPVKHGLVYDPKDYPFLFLSTGFV